MFGRGARGGVGGGKWPGHRVARQAMFVVVRVITEFLGDDPGDAEVQQLDRRVAPVVFLHHHVGRLQVAMDDQAAMRLGAGRSEERRVGKECVRTCRTRWGPYHSKKTKK